MTDKIHDKDNPHPEYVNLQRNISWSKGERRKKYKENFDKIVWNKDKEGEGKCNTNSEKNTTD